MGIRGPAPRREAERRRTNAPDHPIVKMGRDELQALPFEIDLEPTPPEQPGDTDAWHPIVQTFWDELQHDPARKWMTSGDWAATMLVCETVSRELNEHVIGITKEGERVIGSEPMKGATLSAFLKLLDHIGVTESARLRLQKEITLFPLPETVTDGENVVDIASAREADVQ